MIIIFIFCCRLLFEAEYFFNSVLITEKIRFFAILSGPGRPAIRGCCHLRGTEANALYEAGNRRGNSAVTLC